MNNTHYIGRRVSSFELYDELGPITGVSLLLDDESEPINVGDDTGYVLEVSCPYGTETMAQNILSTVQGRTYKGFRAENAILDPLAELGDDLSINGSAFLLAHRIAKFGPGHMSDISAPGENELEHEYGWVSPEKKEFNRKISYVKSEIAKNSNNITLLVKEVHGEDGKSGLIGQYSALSVELDKIALEVHGEDGNGGLTGQYSAITQTVNNLSLKVVGVDGKETSVKLSDGRIDLSGMVTFTALENGPVEEAGQTVINGGWIGTNTLQGKTIKGATYYDDDEVGRLRLGVDTVDEENYPWLIFDAENEDGEVKQLFSIAPIRVDYGWVAMTMLETTVLTVVDGVVNPTAAWNMSRVNMVASSKNYGEADPPDDAVEGQVYFKLIS